MEELLYFGFNPACQCAGLDAKISKSVERESKVGSKKRLLSRGRSAFQDAITSEYCKIDEEMTHVVPLSSGLDSRAILGGLLKYCEIDSDSIITVSFGTPGTWDYEIPQRISRDFGLEHHSIDLTSDSFDWSEDAIRGFAATRESPTRFFEGYVNSTIYDIFDDQCVIWSGYLGDPSYGSHQPDQPTDSWEMAKQQFVVENKFTSDLVSEDFDPLELLPEKPYIEREGLSFEEQLDFAHRQTCFVQPLVFIDRTRCYAPFFTVPWLKFSLNIPFEQRRGRYFFIELMADIFPELFSYPTDARDGLAPTVSRTHWRFRQGTNLVKRKVAQLVGNHYVHPGTNYIDFDRGFRDNDELRAAVGSLVSSFGDRFQIDAKGLFDDHQEGRDNSKELRAICTAELFLSEVQ